MKVTAQHFNALAAAIKPLDTRERRAAYERGEYLNAPAQDLDTRYRWDLFWLAGGFDILNGHGAVYGTSFDYKDAHISTALGRIVPGIEYALDVSDLRDVQATLERPDKLIPVYDPDEYHDERLSIAEAYDDGC